MFTRGSRYENVQESECPTADGRVIRYKRIRYLPPAGGGPSVYTVQQGDRPDTAAAKIAQDPEAFWRLCDANGVARPAELTGQPGVRIIVPQPGGGS